MEDRDETLRTQTKVRFAPPLVPMSPVGKLAREFCGIVLFWRTRPFGLARERFFFSGERHVVTPFSTSPACGCGLAVDDFEASAVGLGFRGIEFGCSRDGSLVQYM